VTTIWKFTLSSVDRQDVLMPANARVLSAKMQHGALCVWAVVDPDANRVQREFRIIGTGHAASDIEGWEFVDTVEMFDGDLILHVFTQPA